MVRCDHEYELFYFCLYILYRRRLKLNKNKGF